MGNFFQGLMDKINAYIQANPTKARIIGAALLLLLLNIIVKLAINVEQPHVALAAQPLLENGPAWFTNSLLTTLIVDVIILVLAFLATRNMKEVPSGLQNLMETLVEFIYNLAESVAGKAASTYFPWVATAFLFIIVSNYSGLIPFVGSWGFEYEAAHGAGHAQATDNQLTMNNGKLIMISAPAQEHKEGEQPKEGEHAAEGDAQHGEAQSGAEEHPAEAAGGHAVNFVPLFRAPTADLSTTFALALATMFMVQYHGVKALGSKYFKKFAFWSPSGTGMMKGINGFVSFLELISEISRILTFAFRLFGNIFAGEVVLAVISFLVPFLIPVVFYGLEVMVGAIQAFVFTMLSLVFFNMATISHEHSDEHHH